jgi:cobalt-zinc-cadmium resistance protein CzcA
MSDQLPPDETPSRTASIMNRLVGSSLAQPLLIILMTLLLTGAGARSLQRLPVDAYPDLSPPIVEIITQWPGHAAEEVERLITVPVELAMNGIPKTVANARSISLYGLSDVIITFNNGTDNNFARQEVFNRLGDPSLPSGVTPSVSPLSAPSGLIYRYVLQSPDRSPMELKTLEAWTVEPQYRSVPGVADDSGFGGGTMQYQVLLDQAKIASVGLSAVQIEAALAANNDNAGGGFYSQGGQFYYVRGLGRLDTLEDISNVVLAVHDGTPVLVKDVGRVAIGIAPRLGEFGYEKQDDAVEGVILLRTGEKTQDVLKRVEAKTHELNEQRPAQGRQGRALLRPQRPDRADHQDRRRQPAARHAAGHRGADLFPLRFPCGLDRCRHHSAGLVVRLHLPRRAGCIGQPAVDRCDRLWHPGRWCGGDGGKHLPPDRRAQRHATQRPGNHPRCSAEVDRPLFYAVAVIVVSFLPIYVLSGPSGTLFKPMADTMIFALVGSLIVTLTLLPVLCAWFMRKGVRERRNGVFEAIKSVYVKGLDLCLAYPWATTLPHRHPAGLAAADPAHRRRVHAAAGRRRAVGARHHAVHHLVRRIGQDYAEDTRHPALLPRGHHGCFGTGPA